MPEVPAPEECEPLQLYYRKCAERADDQTKDRLMASAKVSIHPPCIEFFG